MPDRPAVLYICFDPIPSPKGACTHVTAFLHGLTPHYEVTLLCLGDGEETYAGARRIGLALPEANYLDRALAFREAVWDELERARYDVVHFRSMWAALPVAEEQPRQGFRVVCEVNAVESIELKYHYPALRGAPGLLGKLRVQEQQAFRCADVLITPSQVTGDYLIHQQVPAEKIRVIPNGVDTEVFTPSVDRNKTSVLPSPVERSGTGEGLGMGAPQHPVSEDANNLWQPTLLYLGTLAPWQGVEVLLKALKLVRAEVPYRLQIVAPQGGKWRGAVEKLVVKLGLADAVDWLPPVPHAQVPALIRAAGVCVAPLAPTERNTVQGCHPIKLLEYLACGKPIVAADLPVVREILTHEETALLCKMDKPYRLVECLQRLAADPALRHRLATNAAREARDRFTWTRAQQALREVYGRIMTEETR